MLGLAVAGVSAQYSQLGAMIHSMVSADNGALPSSLLYEVNSWGPIAVNAAATILLGPVAYLGFSALNRPHAHRLSAVYLLICSSLLIPVRHGLPLAAVLIGVALTALWFDSRFMAGTTGSGTAEGIVSRVLLLLPVGILITRAAFYSQSVLFVGLISILVGLLSFEMLPRFVKENAARTRLQAFTTAPIVVGWFVIAFQYLPTVSRVIPPVFTWLPLSLILIGLSWRTFGAGITYRKAASLLAGMALLGQLTTQPNVLMSFLCLVFSLGMVMAGFRYQERVVFSTGLVGAIFALGYHLRFAVQLYAYSPWGLLAGMGVLILLTASYMEKHAARVFGRLVLFREEIKGWR